MQCSYFIICGTVKLKQKREGLKVCFSRGNRVAAELPLFVGTVSGGLINGKEIKELVHGKLGRRSFGTVTM